MSLVDLRYLTGGEEIATAVSPGQEEFSEIRAEGVGFEPTRTRQRPNGFQDRLWFTVRYRCYLRR
jgi:hypothetical protein